MKRVFAAVGLAIVATLATSCGVTPPTTPGGGGNTLAVSSVAPASVSTTGGATITITGTGFGADSTLTIGGAAVSGATVTATSITATAPARAAGATTVVVTSGSKTASGSLTFVAPSGLNAPPAISNLRVTGPGSKPPSPFVDLASSVTLSATVTDVETSPSTLTYAWTVGAGTVSGTGASVTWTLPATLAVTPSAQAVTLTVTETFTENSIQHRNVATSSILGDAHDSATEILDKGFRFLDLFSQDSVLPSTVMSDFTTTCPGTQQELDDTIDARLNYEHLSYTITRLPPVEFKYGQSCVWPAGMIEIGDACASYRVHWMVRALRDVPDENVFKGDTGPSDGRDFISSVFRNGQWKLCSSRWLGESPTMQVTGLDGKTRVIATPKSLGGGRIRREQ